MTLPSSWLPGVLGERVMGVVGGEADRAQAEPAGLGADRLGQLLRVRRRGCRDGGSDLRLEVAVGAADPRQGRHPGEDAEQPRRRRQHEVPAVADVFRHVLREELEVFVQGPLGERLALGLRVATDAGDVAELRRGLAVGRRPDRRRPEPPQRARQRRDAGDDLGDDAVALVEAARDDRAEERVEAHASGPRPDPEPAGKRAPEVGRSLPPAQVGHRPATLSRRRRRRCGCRRRRPSRRRPR